MSRPSLGDADHQEAIALAEALIAVQSHLEVEGREAEIGRRLQRWFADHGIPAERQRVKGERANLVARVSGSPGPTLLLNGHLDTVPAGAMADAFQPRRRDGVLHGRGACDMKGAIAAMAVATAVAARSPDALAGTLLFAGTVDEESGSLGVRALLDSGVQADYAVVGEPTSLRVAVAHKGSCFVRVELTGRGAHGSCPEEGVNAALLGARIAVALEDTLADRLRGRTHPLLGRSTVNLGRLCGGTQPNIVAERCVLEIDRRLLPGEQGPVHEIEALIAPICEAAGVAFEIREMPMTARVPHVPLGTDPNSPIARAARAACVAAGIDPEPIGVTYWTDGGHLSARGIETVILGPGDIRFAHGPEEHVAEAEIIAAAQIYLEIAGTLLSAES
jgi:acetylornithine deacetylase/succinyl-diaminopimelate desuccinylase